jgi:hypothetical protein
VSERLSLLPPEQQGPRYAGALALFQERTYAPADCMIAAAVRAVQDAQCERAGAAPEVLGAAPVVELAGFAEHVHLRDPAAKERLVASAPPRRAGGDDGAHAGGHRFGEAGKR